MIDLLKFIWSGIKSLGKNLLKVWAAIWNVLSSLVTWVVGTIYYLLSTAWDWISDQAQSFFDSASSLFSDADGLFGSTSWDPSPLALHLADLFQLPVAIECLGVLVLAFVTAKLLRLAMVPIRAILELL